MVQALVDSHEAAPELQSIVDILKKVDAHALAALREVFEHAMLLGAMTGATDAMIAACREQWLQEQEPLDVFAS